MGCQVCRKGARCMECMLRDRLTTDCTCDQRFVGVARDIDCPSHGLERVVLDRGLVDDGADWPLPEDGHW